ncbi:NUDIX domain-containing protein [Embleya scabrispora]|uniref:NUDIX domain-containing protein n=1 Tax=Embleya scabrispora TaxID=159449 RepID=UPI00068E5DA5|nr:NUDIX hydrolase [Embleya scabrispora]MYS81022.1 NUDIX domain-containing protein [Streptomyces sp. SID5474]
MDIQADGYADGLAKSGADRRTDGGANRGAAGGLTTAAGALFFDGEGRVLLVEPDYKPGLEFPGGIVEPGESPWAGCVREVREELGIALDGPPNLLVAQWVAPVDGHRGGMRWLFDGGVLSPRRLAEIRLQADELRAWHLLTPDQGAAAMPAERAQRLRAALRARGSGRGMYVEAAG